MNFRQVRKKIKTIGNVKQITKAMHMVSSVKMKKAQDVALEGQLYRQILQDIRNKVVQTVDTQSSVYQQSGKNIERQSKCLHILVTSNKGLCVSFNFNLFKFMINQVNIENDDFITLGKKGADFLLKMRANVLADFSTQLPFVDNTSAVFTDVSSKFLNGSYKEINLIYNHFISTLKNEPIKKMLLPMRQPVPESEKPAAENKSLYLIEPSPNEVLNSLIVDSLKDEIRSAILESEAAEHSARMVTMKNATDAASDLIYNLTLLRNKLRQASITTELLDITTAKESSDSIS